MGKIKRHVFGFCLFLLSLFSALDDYWVARLGILRRGTTLPSPYEQIHPIHRIILHPGYMDAGFINDISLLEMKNEVQFTNYVRPICLPQAATILPDGTLCTVIGWGQLMEIGRVFRKFLFCSLQLKLLCSFFCSTKITNLYSTRHSPSWQYYKIIRKFTDKAYRQVLFYFTISSSILFFSRVSTITVWSTDLNCMMAEHPFTVAEWYHFNR